METTALVLLTLVFLLLRMNSSHTSEYNTNDEYQKELKSVLIYERASLQQPLERGLQIQSSSVSNQLYKISNGRSNMSSLFDGLLKELLVFLLLRTSVPCNIFMVNDESRYDISETVQHLPEMGSGLTMMSCDSDLGPLRSTMNITKYFGSLRYFILLCSPELNFKLFQMVAAGSMESATTVWYVISEDFRQEQLQSVLREGTQVVLLTGRNGTDPKYFISSSYVNSNNMVRFQDKGWWKKNKNKHSLESSLPLQKVLIPPLDEIYQDFQGRELKAAVVNNWPFFGVEVLPNGGGVKPSSGIDSSIITTLGQTLNFTFKLVESIDGQWGGPQDDGSITGMIGMVARHEVDLAIDEITITGRRKRVIDFTYPYYQETTSLLSRAPKQKNKAFAAFSPFNALTWGLLLGTTCLIAFSIWIIKSFYRHLLQYSSYSSTSYAISSPSPSGGCSNDTEVSCSSSFSIQYAISDFYNSLVGREGGLLENGSSIRLLLAFWYIFCSIVSAVYSGSLTAFLAIPSFEKPIDSLADLVKAKADGVVPRFLTGTSTHFMFQEATSGIYQQIWQSSDPVRSFAQSADDCVEPVLKDKVVCITAEMGSNIRARKRGIEKFYMAKERFYPQGYGIVLRKGSPYLHKFNKMLLRMIESGLIVKWTRNEVKKVSSMGASGESEQENGPQAITMTHLQAPFYLLGLFYFVASLVFAIEMCLQASMSRRTKILQ